MDPISVVGIAAATLQFVDFSSRLLATGWHVYRDNGESPAMKGMSTVSTDLNRLVKGIANAIKSDEEFVEGEGVSDGAHSIGDSQFTQLLHQAEKIATDIKVTFAHSLPEQGRNGTIRAKVRGTIEQTMKSRDVGNLTERLHALRNAVMDQLTASTW